MTHFWFRTGKVAVRPRRRARPPGSPHEYLTVAQLVERGTVNEYSGDP